MSFLMKYIAIPFGMLLSVFYAWTGNYLLSLFLMTLIIRLLLVPTAIHQQKGQAKQLRLQPKVNKIREKYASEGREGQMKISQETQDLYKREGYNATTSGCLPLLIQLPVMMGLYGVIYTPLTHVLRLGSDLVTRLTEAASSIVAAASEETAKASARAATQLEITVLREFETIKTMNIEGLTDKIIADIQTFSDKFKLFGIDLTLTTKGNEKDWVLWIIPVVATISSLAVSLYTTLRQRKTQPEAMKGPMAGCMMIYGPAISAYFAYILPQGIGVYWIMSNILSLVQTVVLNVAYTPRKVIAMQMVDETVQRRSREQSVKTISEL